MANILYSYAINEEGEIISINEVDSSTCSGRVFTCLSCGEPMIARFGKTGRQPHFAHKSKSNCSPESYIHRLAKHILKETYENAEKYEIKLKRSHPCAESDTCPLFQEDQCYEEKLHPYDLKPYYQLVTEEKSFDGFRADILLESDDPEHKPIFFEIKFRHACTAEKIGSGNHIIEIDVEDEVSLNILRRQSLTASSEIRFIGFQNQSKTPSPLAKRLGLIRFALFNNGKSFVPEICDIGDNDCKNQLNNHSVFEIAMEVPYIGYPNPYDYGYVYALDCGIKFRSCHLCKYRKDGYEKTVDHPHFCCMYKRRGSDSPYPQASEAQYCPFYQLDYSRINDIREKMKEIPIKRIK